jgi:hypothetical protein
LSSYRIGSYLVEEKEKEEERGGGGEGGEGGGEEGEGEEECNNVTSQIAWFYQETCVSFE